MNLHDLIPIVGGVIVYVIVELRKAGILGNSTRGRQEQPPRRPRRPPPQAPRHQPRRKPPEDEWY